MRHKYTVGVFKNQLTRERLLSKTPGYPEVAYKRVVLAESRTEALAKCEDEIRRLPHDPSIVYVSVFVGLTSVPGESAGRLHPIQIRF